MWKYMLLVETQQHIMVKQKQIKTGMIPLRASIKHPMNVYIFGYIHCSDWLNACNNKGQCNVLYCSLFLWIAAFFGNLPGCWLFMCCLTSERFKTMGKCVSSNMWLQKPLWHCIKSGYEESRLRGSGHRDASCALTLLTFRAWESWRSQVTWKEKSIKDWHPRKGH